MPRDFRLLLLSTFVTVGSFGLLLPIVPLWAVHGGANAAGAGATNATFLLVTVATQLAAPGVLRRIGHRESLLAGGLLLGLPSFGYAATSGLVPLIAVSAMRGVGFALVVVTGTSLVARLLPGARRGRGVGQYGLAIGLPNLVFLPAGPWVAEHLSFQLVFVIAGVLPIAGTGVVACMRIRTRHAAGRARRAPAENGQSGVRRFGAPFVVMCCHALASSAIVTFLPAAIAGAGTSAGGLFCYSVGAVVGRWGAGILRDRHRRPVTLGPAALVCVAGLLALGVAAHSAGTALVASAALPGALAFGLGFGAIQNDTLTAMFDRVPASGYDVASTAWNMAFDSGTGIGSLAVGIVATAAGFPPAYVVVAALLAAVTPAAVGLGRSHRSAPAG